MSGEWTITDGAIRVLVPSYSTERRIVRVNHSLTAGRYVAHYLRLDKSARLVTTGCSSAYFSGDLVEPSTASEVLTARLWEEQCEERAAMTRLSVAKANADALANSLRLLDGA